MVSKRVEAASGGRETGFSVGPLLQRRALLVSPDGPVKAHPGGHREALGLGLGRGRLGPQIGQLAPGGPGIRLMPARGAPPVPLAEPDGAAASDDAQGGHQDQQQEQRQRDATGPDRSP